MFKDVYKGKKVLITGNTGFKGSWLTVWLLKLGARVFGLSKDIPTNPSMFEELGLEKKIVHNTCDIRDLNDVKKIVKDIKPDFLFHLAAQSLVKESYKNPIETISTNVLGTANILESMKEINYECTCVIITSDKCYDNVEWLWGYKETDSLGGKDIYSGSKGAAELIIKSFFYSFFSESETKVKIASARAGNVIGGGDWAKDRIIPDCMKAWSVNKIVDIRSPAATRPWQHVLEPLSGYLSLGEELSIKGVNNGESYNFGPPANQNHPVRELIDEMSKHWGKVRWVDVSENKNHFHEAGLLKLNCDKALSKLRWLPTLGFMHTVKMTTDWYKTFYQGSGNSMYAFTNNQIDEYISIAASRKIVWSV